MVDLRLAWNRPARLPDGSTEHVLLVGMTPQAALSRLPGNFCLVLDCSGSMEGQKLEDARAACRLALGCLQGDDTWSLVAFNSTARPILVNQSCRDLADASVTRHLGGLTAEGTTRLDLAISEARKALRPNMGPGTTSEIILITDGHPTNARGTIIEDCSPFLATADGLSAEGITLITVGLGSARHYNSTFLTDLADRGRGRFCYAPEPGELADILAGQIRASQSTVIAGLELAFRPRMRGSEVNAFCRIAPQFMPFDAVTPSADGAWHYPCGSLQARGGSAETVFLARVEVQGVFGMSPGAQPIMDVTPSWQQPSGSRATGVVATASLNFTTMMREWQAMNDEAERLRLLWDLNGWQDELGRSSDLRRTGNLLERIAAVAGQAGRPDVAAQANAQLAELRDTGNLDPDSIVVSSQNVRDTRVM
jgi:Ca-activated chloride channel family protein